MTSSEGPALPFRVLLIIPAYNEEEALPATLADLQSLPAGYEVVVVNDGSRDRTGAVAAEVSHGSRVPIHILNLPMNGGIGVAVQTGYLFAVRHGFRYAIQFDADGQHDAAYVPALVAECEEKGLDLCIGSRFVAQNGDGFQSTFTRRLGIRFFSWLIAALSGARVTDPTSGFRCAGERAYGRFARHYPEDYPEPESLFWCVRNGLRVGELPVRMRERQGGTSSIRKLRTVYYMLKVSLAILFDRLRARRDEVLTAERLMLLGGMSAFLLTLYWVRRRNLREKYAVGWILVATGLLLLGLFPNTLMLMADAAHLSYPAAVLFLALAADYLFSFAVTVSLTRQYRRNVRVLQEMALLERRLRALEERLGPDDKVTR